jgi:sec-independent protein translocase protein TatA
MFSQIGATEILIILGIVVLLFGAKKLPELARGSGEALRIFKSEVKGDEKDAHEALEASADPAAEKKPEQQV